MAANQRGSEITHRLDYPGYRCSPWDCSTHNDCHGRSTASASPSSCRSWRDAARLGNSAGGLGSASRGVGIAAARMGRTTSGRSTARLGWDAARMGPARMGRRAAWLEPRADAVPGWVGPVPVDVGR
jgi:hypothetical protein